MIPSREFRFNVLSLVIGPRQRRDFTAIQEDLFL